MVKRYPADFAQLFVARDGASFNAGLVAKTAGSASELYLEGTAARATCVVSRELGTNGSGAGTIVLGTFADRSQIVAFHILARRVLAERGAGLEAEFALAIPRVNGGFEAQRRLMESAVANATDAIVITEASPLAEPGPRIVYVNGAFERMTGYDAADVVGRSPRFLQGPQTTLESRRQMREAFELGQRIELDIVNYRRNGETHRLR